jgi:uncharacterized protein (DUF488 family)
MLLFTVGHSNHSFQKFVGLLQDNGVQALVDVRSAPASKYSPQFNKHHLQAELPAIDIEYAFAGKFLGGRPEDPTCYKSRVIPNGDADYLHEVDYPAVMQRDWFRKGMARLLEIAETQATAIMCSEENPAECHRHHLIAKFLMQEHPDIEIKHIRGDGTVFNARSLLMSVNQDEAEQPSLFD